MVRSIFCLRHLLLLKHQDKVHLTSSSWIMVQCVTSDKLSLHHCRHVFLLISRPSLQDGSIQAAYCASFWPQTIRIAIFHVHNPPFPCGSPHHQNYHQYPHFSAYFLFYWIAVRSLIISLCTITYSHVATKQQQSNSFYNY